MTAYGKMSFYDRVMARQADMESERRVWDAARQEIVEHFRPDLTTYSDGHSAETGQFVHGDSITEGTGAWALDVMSRGFLSGMVGASLKWVRHFMRNRRLRGVDPINSWLQRFDDWMLEDVYGLSNFYEISGQLVKDGLSIGSPVLWMVENQAKRRIECMLPHYEQNYLLRDFFGNDIAYHRKFELNNMQAASLFGRANLPPEIQQALDSGEHTKARHTYLMVVYEAGDPILRDYEDAVPSSPEKSNLMYRPLIMRRWCQYFFYYKATDERYKGALPLGVPGFDYQPFSAWHYWRNSHETYARTPAWSAIFDEKGGQSAWATMHDSAQMAANAPKIGLREMKNRIHFSPGRWTWAQSAEEYDRPPKALNDAVKYPHAIDFVDRLDDKRKRHFHVDLFRMLDEYHREHKQPPTAFEIAQMMAEKNAQIGPAIVSFDRGLLGPNDVRMLEIKTRTGEMFRQTEPPMEVMGMTLDDMMPVFTGPLAQAQKIAVTMRRVQDPLSLIAPLFDLWPDARYKIKADVLTEKVLEDLDFYQEAIATEEEYNAIMDAITRQRARQTALQEASIAADIVPKLQGQTADNSPLKQLVGAA